MTQTWLERLRYAWWFHVRRHLTMDAVCWRLAFMVPRRIALLVFIRVYAWTGDVPDEYSASYDAWANKAGR